MKNGGGCRRSSPRARAPLATEVPGLTRTERRVLALEQKLKGPLARLVGRPTVLLLLGAKRPMKGVLWLPLARRVDRRGVVYDLAVVLKGQKDDRGGRLRRRRTLSFDVTHAPGGDPDAADTTRWPDADVALLDYYRGGPFWLPAKSAQG